RVQRKGDLPFVSPPACRVELDLSRLEGAAVGARKEGVYGGFLPAEKGEVLVLEAKNFFPVRGVKTAGGFVSLTIDGSPAGLMFKATFAGTKETTEESLPAVTRAVCRIVAAPIAAPLPKFPIKLELDANVAEIRKVRLGVRSAVAKDDKGKVVETFATVKEFA